MSVNDERNIQSVVSKFLGENKISSGSNLMIFEYKCKCERYLFVLCVRFFNFILRGEALK